MKRNLVKHLLSFAAAMTLCTAILLGSPSGGIFLPGEPGGSPTVLGEEPQNPAKEEKPGQEKGQEPGIAPLDDRPPNRHVKK